MSNADTERTGYGYTKLQLTNPVDAHGPVVDVQTWYEPFGLRIEGKIPTDPEDERYV
jgi:hypothetical protein